MDQEQGYLVSASCETVLHQDGTAIKVCQGAQQDDELRSNAESVAKISVCKLHSASRHGHACSNVPVPVAALTSPAREQGGPTDLVKHGMAARCILSHALLFWTACRIRPEATKAQRQNKIWYLFFYLDGSISLSLRHHSHSENTTTK